MATILAASGFTLPDGGTCAGEPAQGTAKQVDLGGGVTLEVVYIPPGQFTMGSTPEERAWATGIEGGATPGTSREQPEGDPRPAHVKHGFWMGRTEVSVGQFRRFVEETGYVSDAEKPGGWTQCFDPQGAHEEAYFVEDEPRPVCRGGNYFDVPGNARCAVRLGIRNPTYSDSRDGFRICLGPPVPGVPVK